MRKFAAYAVAKVFMPTTYLTELHNESYIRIAYGPEKFWLYADWSGCQTVGSVLSVRAHRRVNGGIQGVQNPERQHACSALYGGRRAAPWKSLRSPRTQKIRHSRGASYQPKAIGHLATAHLRLQSFDQGGGRSLTSSLVCVSSDSD
jgi:hypothetical protein